MRLRYRLTLWWLRLDNLDRSLGLFALFVLGYVVFLLSLFFNFVRTGGLL